MFEEWFQRGIYQRNSLSIISTSSIPCDREVAWCPEYEAHFMELLWSALHLNTEKIKVNMFMFGLIVSIRAKVRIMIPQTFHDVIQKALIEEEDLISGVQRRTPAIPTWKVSSGVQQHQTPTRQSLGYRGFQRGSTFTTHR
jgi:hypothetical protein